MEIKDYGQIVTDILKEYKLPAEPAGLYRPIEYTLDCGGKRLRPQLLLAACQAFGGNLDQARPAALAIEMFHNFTLLHDDVMDRAELRRGRPTVHVKWDEVTAILSGDAMLTLAGELMNRLPDSCLRAGLSLFNRTAMEIYEGQQYDMDFEKSAIVTIAQYMEMIRLKTAVLLGCACELGAMIAGASEADRKAMYDYGINLGLAFQLRDDWLDTYGDSEEFGKNIGSDILNRKKTWLLITALQENNEELSDILREDLEDAEMIHQVKRVFDQLNLSDRCSRLIKEYANKAIGNITKTDMPAGSKEFFTNLATRLSERKY